MGTSKSYGGPSGGSGLLPSWAEPAIPAIPAPVAPGVPAPPPDGGVPSPEDGTAPNLPLNPALPAQQGGAPATMPPQPQQPLNYWPAAKKNLTRYVSSGKKRNLRAAARSYVRARGGARGASASSTSGRQATSRFASFVSSVANNGIRETLKSFHLESQIGKSVEDVLAAVCDALAPDAALLDDVASRAAIADVLGELYEKYDLGAGIEKLDAMDKTAVVDAVEMSVVAYIYERWLQELGRCIEKNSVSAEQAVRLERDVKQYVRDEVHCQFENVDVLTVDWSGTDAQRLIDGVYAAAYASLE